MGNGVKAGEAKTCLKKAKQPGNTIRPAALVDELSIHKSATLVRRTRASEDRDGDNNEPSDAPNERRFGYIRQRRIHESIDYKRNHIVTNIYQKLMPSLRIIALMIKRDRTHNQLAAQQPSGSNQRNPPRYVDPAGDPGENGHPRLPAYDCDPVILPPCGWVCGKKLREGGSQAEIAGPGGDQAPDDGCWASTWQSER